MQSTAQHAEAIRMLVILAAVAIVAFWRTALRLLMVIVIATISYGIIVFWQNTHHIAG